MADATLTRTAAQIGNYAKGAVDAIARHRLMPAMLKKHGNVMLGEGGSDFFWQVEYKQGTARVNDGTQSITPAAVDRWKQPTLKYVGLETNDLLTKRDYLANKDKRSQLINLMGGIKKRVVDDLSDAWAEQFYVDGVANAGYQSGLQTFTAYTQTFDNTLTTPAGRTANAADPLGYPNDAYGGFNTVVADVSGTWTGGNYRTGTGTPDYDWWSPIIIRTQSTFFGGSTFANNSTEAFRLGIQLNQRQKPRGGGLLSTVLCDNAMWYSFANRHDAKERVTIKEAMQLSEYGQNLAQGVIMTDGVAITWEYGVPANRGFGINWDSVTYRSMQDELIELDRDSPKWLSTEQSWEWIATLLGNFEFHTPRNFVYFDNNY